MKIELTLPALERLIGGDTEMEVAIKKQIVHEFAKRHLREVAESEGYKRELEEAKDYVNGLVKEAWDVENLVNLQMWPTVGSRLHSLLDTLVKKEAQAAVDAAVLKIVEYQKRYWADEIEQAVKKVEAQVLEEKIREGIQKRLEALAASVGAET